MGMFSSIVNALQSGMVQQAEPQAGADPQQNLQNLVNMGGPFGELFRKLIENGSLRAVINPASTSTASPETTTPTAPVVRIGGSFGSAIPAGLLQKLLEGQRVEKLEEKYEPVKMANGGMTSAQMLQQYQQPTPAQASAIEFLRRQRML